MPPGAPLIHLLSTQMPPGAGRGGETAEGALGPLSPAGTWQGSSGPSRRPGSPEDSEGFLLTQVPRLQAYWDSLTTCPPGRWCPQASPAHVEVGGWGLITLVTHDGSNICRGAQREGEASFLPGLKQPAWVQMPCLPHFSWAILGKSLFPFHSLCI